VTTGEVLGLIGGLLTTFAFVPQIFRIFRTKSAKDISLVFNLMVIVGGSLWLVYGLKDGLLPLIIWNVLGISFNLVILVGILKYSKTKKISG
jgi:MtN3 and saliva related transmembrane protein